MIKRVVAAAMTMAVLAPMTARAATAAFHATGVEAEAGEEMVVTVQNRCAGAALATIRFVGPGNAIVGTQSRPIAKGERAQLAYRLSGRGRIGAEISVACDGGAAPNPLTSVGIRNPATGVQRIAGEVLEGTGI